MTHPEKKIWFPAKTYGWGWGPPCCWQGWVLLGGWLLVVLGGAFVMRSQFDAHPLLFVAFVWGMALVLVCFCWLKGEKPRWRWGKE